MTDQVNRNVLWSVQQGSRAFLPSMLAELFTVDCPYRTPLFRQAWFRGLFTSACWYLISMLAMSETCSPDPIKMMAQALKHPLHRMEGWEHDTSQEIQGQPWRPGRRVD